jgi:hypothetical protein
MSLALALALVLVFVIKATGITGCAFVGYFVGRTRSVSVAGAWEGFASDTSSHAQFRLTFKKTRVERILTVP